MDGVVVVIVSGLLSLELGSLHRGVCVVVEGEVCWRRKFRLDQRFLFRFARGLFRRLQFRIRRIGRG